MSELTLYIMLIFLPGIIAYKVFEELTHQHDSKAYEVVIYSFIFGFLSYFLYFWLTGPIIYWLKGEEFTFYFTKALVNPKTTENIDFHEITWVSVTALLFGLGVTAFDTYKIAHKYSRFIKVTKKHGELDTFSFLMNSNIGMNPWVIVRDKEDDKAYYGWVYAYSYGHKKNELFLRDVIIFHNSSGEQIATTPGIYLSKPKDKYTIEFPLLKYGAKMEKNLIRKDDE